MNRIIWKRVPSLPVISESAVDIYYVSINSAKGHAASLNKILNEHERERALNFIFEKDRLISIVSRGVLRHILGSYLSVEPEDVVIINDINGKPLIGRTCNNKNISFNLSHSGDIVLYAVTSGRNVGVDVQEMRRIDSMNDIAERYFSVNEISMFNSLPEKSKREAFYNCWSRKEAYIKALGVGLSYKLDSFSVSITPGEDAIFINDENNDISKWSLKEIFIISGYAAAVVVEGDSPVYNYYEWSF